MRTRLAGAPGPLLALVAEGFLSRLSFGFVTFGLPLYAHQLGMDLASIGLLIGLDVSVALALRPFAGQAADRFGLKRTFAGAIGLRSAVALAFALAGAPWQLFGLRALMGLAQALRDPPVTALIARQGGKKSMATAFAWYQTAKAVAGPLGGALAGVLLTLTNASFPLVFGITFLLSLLPLFVVGRFVREHPLAPRSGGSPLPEGEGTGPHPNPLPEGGGASRPRLLIPSFIGLGFLISSTGQMLRGMLPIMATEYGGLSEAQAGGVFLASSVVVLVAGPLLGWLSDNVSRRLVLSTRTVANTASSVLFLVAPGAVGFAVGKTLDDVGKSAFRLAWGTLMAEISELDPPRQARTISLMSMGEDGGEAVGPIVAGLLWSTGGIGLLLGTRIALAVVTEIYATLLTRSVERRQSEAPLAAPQQVASPIAGRP